MRVSQSAALPRCCEIQNPHRSVQLAARQAPPQLASEKPGAQADSQELSSTSRLCGFGHVCKRSDSGVGAHNCCIVEENARDSVEMAMPGSDAPLCDAIERLLIRMAESDVTSADAMAALCHDRAAEIGTMPAPLAAALVKTAVAAVTRTLYVGKASTAADVLATLRHLLACPALRDAAVKSSRLRSLTTVAIDGVRGAVHVPRADAAVAAVVQVLQEAGVGTAMAGTLEQDSTPLTAALQHAFLGSAQVLLEAGADVNGLSRDGDMWPLFAAASRSSDAGMAWLLAHGASLAVTNRHGCSIAHGLAFVAASGAPRTIADGEDFFCRWLRYAIAAEPRLLEASQNNGYTPLMAMALAGSEACVAALLELGANPTVATAAGHTALFAACAANSLPIARQLIAAGAASAAALPRGSLHARMAARRALTVALHSERGCGECAARCEGSEVGNCADGLDILRAVLAAGVHEAVDAEGNSLAVAPVLRACDDDEDQRISAEHALTILQTLHAGGVDVLARGPADELPILHEAAATRAPAVARWLVEVAGAPLEEANREGYTPLLVACTVGHWASALALLDCGARVDVQCDEGSGGLWPVVIVASAPASDASSSLLRRILAADRDSLLRCTPAGISALYPAAAHNTAGLRLLLGSGLPHLAEAINAVAKAPPAPARPTTMTGTPLHCACDHTNWEAALALLAAGARVDIVGQLCGRFQTVAAWARSSPHCKHRGVKLAIAARAKEHASEAGKAVNGSAGSLQRSAGSPFGKAAAATAACASAVGSASASVTAALAAAAEKDAGTGAGAVVSEHGAATGAGAASQRAGGTTVQQGKGGKGRRQGAARNRAEDPGSAAADLAAAAPPAAEAAVATVRALGNSAAAVAPGAAYSEAVQSAADAASFAALNTCEEGPAASSGTARCGSASDVSAAAAGRSGAACINTCEPGAAAAGACSNTCEPNDAATSLAGLASAACV